MKLSQFYGRRVNALITKEKKFHRVVIPAQAGIQLQAGSLDSRLRGNDKKKSGVSYVIKIIIVIIERFSLPPTDKRDYKKTRI